MFRFFRANIQFFAQRGRRVLDGFVVYMDGRDFVGLDLDHLLLGIGADKSRLSQRQAQPLGLGLLDEVLGAQGALSPA